MHVLPDYPLVKSLISDAYQQRVEAARQRGLGFLSQVSRKYLHEGGQCFLRRADGSEGVTAIQRISATSNLPNNFDDIPTLAESDILKLLDNLGESMAFEQAKVMLQTMDQAIKEVGNVGTPGLTTVEQIFEAFEKQQMDFGDDGEPKYSTFMVPSESVGDRIKEALKQIEEDTTLSRRMKLLLEKKREEWRDREASRNLVE